MGVQKLYVIFIVITAYCANINVVNCRRLCPRPLENNPKESGLRALNQVVQIAGVRVMANNATKRKISLDDAASDSRSCWMSCRDKVKCLGVSYNENTKSCEEFSLSPRPAISWDEAYTTFIISPVENDGKESEILQKLC